MVLNNEDRELNAIFDPSGSFVPIDEFGNKVGGLMGSGRLLTGDDAIRNFERFLDYQKGGVSEGLSIFDLKADSGGDAAIIDRAFEIGGGSNTLDCAIICSAIIKQDSRFGDIGISRAPNSLSRDLSGLIETGNVSAVQISNFRQRIRDVKTRFGFEE